MKRYRLNSKIKKMQSGDFVYYYSKIDNCYYDFEEIGNFIIRELCNGKHQEDIIKEIITDYTCDINNVKKDVIEFIDELIELNIIVESNGDE